MSARRQSGPSSSKAGGQGGGSPRGCLDKDGARAALTDTPGATLLRVHAQPGARRSEIAGLVGDAIKVRVAAPPVDGKANQMLLDFLAAALEVRKSALALAQGASSRRKVVRIEGLGAADVAAKLAAAAAAAASSRG